jgi:peroxiredoxin
MTGHLLVGEGVKPNLNLPDSEGNIWSLDDHAGRTVVLIFHRHIH